MALISCRVLVVLFCLFVENQTNPLSRSWTYRDEKGCVVHVIPANLFQHKDRTRDLERGRRCSCYCKRAWEREYSCCECLDSTCFPASARVTRGDGDVITVSDLVPGDKVLTADLNGGLQLTTVLGYLDRRRDVISQYYVLRTSSGAQLTLSASHLVYMSTDNITTQARPRYASDISVGDYLFNVQNHDLVASRVTDISIEGMKGAYVPFTETGTILVDNVLTSCYASFPHDVAHVAMAPLRWFPSLVKMTSQDGVHPYVSFMKYLGRSVLPLMGGRIIHQSSGVQPEKSSPNATTERALQMNLIRSHFDL